MIAVVLVERRDRVEALKQAGRVHRPVHQPNGMPELVTRQGALCSVRPWPHVVSVKVGALLVAFVGAGKCPALHEADQAAAIDLRDPRIGAVALGAFVVEVLDGDVCGAV